MESTNKRKRSGSRPDVYQIVTNRIIDLLDRGTIPWQKPWTGGELPRNLVSNKAYRGINIWLLALAPYSSPYWLTFKQAKSLGGSVKKGEKGTPCIFWKILEKDETDRDTGEKRKRKIFFLRYYTVFNLEQTEDVRVPKGRIADPDKPGGHLDLEDNRSACEKADAIFTDYVKRESIDVSYGGGRAAYSGRLDKIVLPNKDDFASAEGFHSVRFHEATHSTGAVKRCNRPGITEFDGFGSHQYSEEELVAEFGASFLRAVSGIEHEETVENSAAYIANWREKLSKDPKIVVQAAQRAQKAADFILDTQPKSEEKAEEKELATA